MALKNTVIVCLKTRPFIVAVFCGRSKLTNDVEFLSDFKTENRKLKHKVFNMKAKHSLLM